MDIQSDDFTLFGLPQRFVLERAELDARWKDLQRQAHPDRFAAQGAAAQRVAAQWSARINEAYQRLKEPLARGAYLCELRGAPISAHDNTAMPAEFLMQQMQWRDDLDEATTEADLDAVADAARQYQRGGLARLQAELDDHADAKAASQTVRALMFVDKFLQDLGKRYDALL